MGELTHYGVLGMKWGVRNDKTSNGKKPRRGDPGYWDYRTQKTKRNEEYRRLGRKIALGGIGVYSFFKSSQGKALVSYGKQIVKNISKSTWNVSVIDSSGKTIKKWKDGKVIVDTILALKGK